LDLLDRHAAVLLVEPEAVEGAGHAEHVEDDRVDDAAERKHANHPAGIEQVLKDAGHGQFLALSGAANVEQSVRREFDHNRPAGQATADWPAGKGLTWP